MNLLFYDDPGKKLLAGSAIVKKSKLSQRGQISIVSALRGIPETRHSARFDKF